MALVMTSKLVTTHFMTLQLRHD